MLKSLTKYATVYATVIFILITSYSFAGCSCCQCFGDCCQSFEIGLGWRRDTLNWKLDDLEDYCHIDAIVSSHIEFEKMDMYTAYTKAKWIGEAYYVRLSAQYGLTEKGRAEERFDISSPLLGGRIVVHTNDPVKRRSEFYDFNGAVGYPFVYDCYCLNITPLVGFSFHRQRIRSKSKDHSSLSFIVESSNPFGFNDTISSSSSSDDFDFISNPFSSPSDPSIPSAIGLSAKNHTSMYRFTWYGFYLGTDIALALDSCWTIFTELEWHFLDNCHRKRHSQTGVYFVDSYHHKGWASGFNGTVGAAWDVGNCWIALATVDFKYWHAHSHRDTLTWKSVGANLALGYTF